MSIILAQAIRDTFDTKKEMPFAVIGSAISGAVTGAFATGAAVAGTVGGVVASTALVATWVGLGLTIVGAVTGDSDLLKIGGIVGLAGGATGLAISGAASLTAQATAAATATTEAATAAVPAANVGATEAAQGGLLSASKTAVDAITPTTLTNVSAQPVANAATAASNAASTASLGTAGSAALETVVPATKAVTDVATQSTSFFDSLLTPQNLLEVGKIGAQMVSGSAQEEMANNRLEKQQELEREKLAYEKDKYNTQMTNINSPAKFGLNAKQLTPEERDKAAEEKAARARRTAKILTDPAGT